MEFVMVLADIGTICTSLTTGSATKIAYMISLAISAIQIVVPILLIIWGMLDLGKAVMAQKEDEIKKGQNTFIKRLVAAAIVFFIVTIVKVLISLVSDDKESISACIDAIINCKNAKSCS